MKVPQIRSDQLLSRVRLFATPWITACQASLSLTNSQSSLRLTSIESVMPSSHLILCRPLLLPSPVHFPRNSCCSWLLTLNNGYRRTNRWPSGPTGCQMNSSLSLLYTSSLASPGISKSIIPAMMVLTLLTCWILGTRSLKCPGINFDLKFGGTPTVSSDRGVLCLETRISRATEPRVKGVGSKTTSRSLRLMITRTTLICTP